MKQAAKGCVLAQHRLGFVVGSVTGHRTFQGLNFLIAKMDVGQAALKRPPKV